MLQLSPLALRYIEVLNKRTNDGSATAPQAWVVELDGKSISNSSGKSVWAKKGYARLSITNILMPIRAHNGNPWIGQRERFNAIQELIDSGRLVIKRIS